MVSILRCLKDAIAAKFAKKSQEIVDKNLAAFDDGYGLVMENWAMWNRYIASSGKKDQMFLLGNEACALGAIAAGSRFMASYPITPASEVMEYMIKNMDKLGATIVQTEDEIAACMTAMGGVYAGVRGFTCTSGPGLSLMAESLSMASMAELPMVVIDVQRSGPSTGMATRLNNPILMQLAIMHMAITLVSLFLQHLSKNASMKFKKLSTWQKCTNAQLSSCLIYNKV